VQLQKHEKRLGFAEENLQDAGDDFKKIEKAIGETNAQLVGDALATQAELNNLRGAMSTTVEEIYSLLSKMKLAQQKLPKVSVVSNPFCFTETVVLSRKTPGTMFVMDCTNTLYRMGGTGLLTPCATINGHFLGMVVDASDNIYYSSLDYINDTIKYPTPAIYRVLNDGRPFNVDSATMYVDLTGVMVYPAGMCISGNYIYVADSGGNTIAKVDMTTGKVVNPAFITLSPPNNPTMDPTKSVTANAALPAFNMYGGNHCNLTVDASGNFIVLCGIDNDYNNTTVAKYDANGKFVANLATTVDGLSAPIGVAVGANGKIYVSNQNGTTVSVLSPK
jgi:sugar lactone lactonase YvrE